ncbi:33681_t:CDS:2, partial [Gigaspora margarita]
IGNEPDTLELDYDDNLVSLDKQEQSKLIESINFTTLESNESTPMSKNYKMLFYYAEKLKNLRKANKKLEIFVSNLDFQDEMYLQPIESYFKKDTILTSFKPLPKLRIDIEKVYVDYKNPLQEQLSSQIQYNLSILEDNMNNSSLSSTIENINLSKLLLDLGIKQGNSDESTWENINTIFGHTN